MQFFTRLPQSKKVLSLNPLASWGFSLCLHLLPVPALVFYGCSSFLTRANDMQVRLSHISGDNVGI